MKWYYIKFNEIYYRMLFINFLGIYMDKIIIKIINYKN